MRFQPFLPGMRRAYLCAALAAGCSLTASPAFALDFEFADTTVRLDNLLTIGSTIRTQGRDADLLGKSNLHPGLCLRRISGDIAGPDATGNRYSTGDIAAACGSTNADAIQQYVAAPGAYSPNGDDGDLNFDRGDVVSAAAKLTTDLSFDAAGFSFFGRALYLFDAQYERLDASHPDTTLNYAGQNFSSAGKSLIGNDFRILDYTVTRSFEIGGHEVAVKLGRQVVNWGESAYLVANSLNSINPPSLALARLPGADIKEVFQPLGMLTVNADIAAGLAVQMFYQYEWKPVEFDPVGSFFSTSDVVGAGGRYLMLAFGRAPEDPGSLYRAIDTCSAPLACADILGLLGSTSSRTLYRDADEERRREPSDGGQYGAVLKYFADEFNGGTEFGLYYANYHSRFPIVSAIAAQETCIRTALDVLPGGACGVLLGTGLPAAREPIPVDTARLLVEYPENIHLYGVSFNTPVGEWAVAGEYTYRPNLPVQVHPIDVVFAALQPAFPESDVSLLGLVTIPGRRSAAPDFLMTDYRGEAVQPGQYIRGYERMKQGQANLSFIRIFGGSNFLAADQITAVIELGHAHVFDMPKLSELQFAGGIADTHISSGADGSVGVNPRDVRTDPGDPSTNRSDPESRQNVVAQANRDAFGTADSYGYRLVLQTRYEDAFWGVNVEWLEAFFHDVKGVGPGTGQNFIQGRRQLISGVKLDTLGRYYAELRYTWIFDTGLDASRDRDNLVLSLAYQF